jgi:xylulokinase
MRCLGLDVGTQGTKALVVDVADGSVLARASVGYGLIEGLPSGHAEQHPQTWLDAITDAVRALAADVDLRTIEALAVSGQQHGAVVLDAAGRVVRPAKLWCDTATVHEARELSARLGRPLPPAFTLTKLLWLARHEPERWAQVAHVLLPHDYVNGWLTGERSAEAGDASGTGWFDPCTLAYDDAALRLVDERLPRMIPPLREPGTLAGRLTAATAEVLGLVPGIPVATGGGDNMMAAIGSGATAAGVLVASLGTSGTLFTRTTTPLVDERGQVMPFCSSDGAWLPLLCVQNLTGVLAAVERLTGQGHDALTAAAADVPPGSEGLLWLPFLQGERLPDLPEATGTLLGLHTAAMRPGALYRAALEGITLNLALGLDRLRDFGLYADEVRLAGGGARNVLWQQILADVFDLPVRTLLEPEAAALGAALQAAHAVRVANGEDVAVHDVAAPCVRLGPTVAPQARWRPLHQALRLRYRHELQRLHPGALPDGSAD